MTAGGEGVSARKVQFIHRLYPQTRPSYNLVYSPWQAGT